MRHLLENPLVYAVHTKLFNPDATRRRLIADCAYRPGRKVLDIGCGPGTFSAFFRPEDYTGVDISAAYVEHARQHFGGTYHVLPAERVGELEGRYDIALMVGVFHHLTDDQVRETLAGLRLVLNPDGRFRLLEAVWPTRWYDFPGWLIRRLDRGLFVRTREEWCRLLGGTGWALENVCVERHGLIEFFECFLRPPTPGPVPA